jgi:phosphohistidine phosphatase
MKRLILIRHAKSSWSEPFGADHDRPLNERGQDSCPRVGGWLRDKGYTPDFILCSTAARCVETCARISDTASWSAEPEYSKAIYHAGTAQLTGLINKVKEDTLAVFGHNPGIGALAEELAAGPSPEHPKFFQYPAGAVTVLDFDIDDWALISSDSGTIRDFVVPRDLP